MQPVSAILSAFLWHRLYHLTFLPFRNNPQIPILKHKPARRKRRQRRRQKHRRHHRKLESLFHLLFPHTRSPLSPNIRLINLFPNQTAKQLHSRFPSSTSILFTSVTVQMPDVLHMSHCPSSPDADSHLPVNAINLLIINEFPVFILQIKRRPQIISL